MRKLALAARQFFTPTRIHIQPGAGGPPRVLLLSMRRMAALAAYCALYEFEDAIVAWTGADRVEPECIDRIDLARKAYRVARAFTGSAAVARRLTPRARGLSLEGDYDLFFPVFNNPFEIFALDAVPDWRRRSRFAACFVSEVWESELPEYLVEQLSRFDRIYLGMTAPTGAVARITGRPCEYLPIAVDAKLFAPLPAERGRCIDVCGIGRRSPVTHAALIEGARRRGLFYYYDSIRTRDATNPSMQITFSVSDPAEHRLLLANLLKRSRFFLASRARANEPAVTGGSEEIAYRFFEAAAAGTVMVGDPPKTDTFREHFDWPGAVIEAPYDCPGIVDIVEELGRDETRLARIRTDNVANGLLRHDWVHRLARVFRDAGYAPTEAMEARVRDLRDAAASVRASGIGH